MYDPKNEVHTTLASAFVHGTDVTMVLTSATGFPATGNYIRISGIDTDEEWALYEYTGISTNTLTGLTPCTLGNVESTAAHTFGVGSIVEVMFVAEYLRDLESDAVLDALFDANTILKADSDNTPAALTVAEQRIVGRITAGVITALTAAQVNTLLATFLADGSVEMTGALTQQPLSADPGDPDAGNWTFWISDGTDSFEAGDVCVKINVLGTTKTFRLIDYSAH